MTARFLSRRFLSNPQSRSSPINSASVATSRAFNHTAAVRAEPPVPDERVNVVHNQNRPAFRQRRRPLPRRFLPGLSAPFGQSPTSVLQMLDSVDRLFENSFMPAASNSFRNNDLRTPWDVMEDNQCYKLRVDMPGMSKEEVKLTIEDGELVMKAEHNEEETKDDWSSRSYGAYDVRLKLPENVDVGGIKAEMKNGVLKVIAPKMEKGKEKHEVLIE